MHLTSKYIDKDSTLIGRSGPSQPRRIWGIGSRRPGYL